MVTSLRGTPVVPGLAYGPVVLVAQEVSPEAVAAYAEPDGAEAAMATATSPVRNKPLPCSTTLSLVAHPSCGWS